MKSRSFSLAGGLALVLAGLSPTAGSVAAASVQRVSVLSPAARGAAAMARADAYSQGQADLRAGRYKQAEAAFRTAIAHHIRVLQSYEGLAAAATRLRDYSTAARAYGSAVKLQPSNATLQYAAAYSALYANDYHAAVRYAGGYIKLRPRDPRGFHLRFLAEGSLFQRKPQLNDALRELKLEPNNASAYNDVGIAQANNKQYRKAVATLTRAIALDRGNGGYYANRALAEYELKELKAALSDYQRALARTTDPTRKRQLTNAITFLRKQIHH